MKSMVAFANQWRPGAAAELAAIERDQIVAAARQYDGRTRSPEAALDQFSEPERWDVVDSNGRTRFQIWITGVDSGVVFHAGTSVIIGDIIQCGFACNDLLAWSLLAAAAPPRVSTPLAMVDFALDPDAGPTLFRIDPDHPASALWREDHERLALGPAWLELAALVAPWDGDIHALITGSTRARRSPRHGIYGLASHYPAPLIATLSSRFAEAPAHPLLAELATFVSAAASDSQDIAVCV